MRIEVRNLTKVFTPMRGEAVHAVDDVSIDVDDGEFLVILGPSGSGKTTLLRCIAGLERADAGEITIDGRVVYSSERRVWVPPERRGVSMVFQSYALWPHMTVFDNVAYPLRAQRRRDTSVRDAVTRALSLVSCERLGARYPSQLSGGQQQRVAVARSIVGGDKVVLFDEPLSAVDARVRDVLRRELVSLQRELGFASVYITHDQTEASMMGHRVAVLADGKVLQIAPPRDIYDQPNSLFVAEFMGAANRFDTASEHVEEVGDGRFRVQTAFGDVVAGRSEEPNGGRLAVIFRPEHGKVTFEKPSAAANVWRCKVEIAAFLGFCTEYQLKIADETLLVRSMERTPLDEGADAWLQVDPNDVRLVPAE